MATDLDTDEREPDDPAMSWVMMTPEELRAATDITQRLRGVYAVPINDGAGPLNGGNTAVRTFPTAPIQHEAADEIEGLRRLVGKMRKFIWGMQQQGATVPNDPPLDDGDMARLVRFSDADYEESTEDDAHAN